VRLRKPFSKRPGGGKTDIWTNVDGLAGRTSVDRVPDRTSVDGVPDRTSVDRVPDRTSVDGVASGTSVAVIVRQPSARDLHRGSPADG